LQRSLKDFPAFREIIERFESEHEAYSQLVALFHMNRPKYKQLKLTDFFGVNMKALEFRHLKRLCDKYGLDYQELDNTLTYYENKKHLLELARMLSQSLDVFELARMESLQEQYMKEHFLSYYVLCQMAGETRSAEVGEPYHHRFSLEAYIQNAKSMGRHHQNV